MPFLPPNKQRQSTKGTKNAQQTTLVDAISLSNVWHHIQLINQRLQRQSYMNDLPTVTAYSKMAGGQICERFSTSAIYLPVCHHSTHKNLSSIENERNYIYNTKATQPMND